MSKWWHLQSLRHRDLEFGNENDVFKDVKTELGIAKLTYSYSQAKSFECQLWGFRFLERERERSYSRREEHLLGFIFFPFLENRRATVCYNLTKLGAKKS